MYKKINTMCFLLATSCIVVAPVLAKTMYTKENCFFEDQEKEKNHSPETISITPQEEIKALLCEERKHNRIKVGNGIASAATFGLMCIMIALESHNCIANGMYVAGSCATASVITGTLAVTNWWAEKRSRNHAEELAQEYGLQIVDNNRVPDDTDMLKDDNNDDKA